MSRETPASNSQFVSGFEGVQRLRDPKYSSFPDDDKLTFSLSDEGKNADTYLIVDAEPESMRTQDPEHPLRAKGGPLKMGEVAVVVTLRSIYAPDDVEHTRSGELIFGIGAGLFQPRRFTDFDSLEE